MKTENLKNFEKLVSNEKSGWLEKAIWRDKNEAWLDNSAKIAELLKPDDCKAEIEIVYQTVEKLHKACPNDLGDWYFTGNYPTPGGNRVVNSSFINFVEGKDKRAY